MVVIISFEGTTYTSLLSLSLSPAPLSFFFFFFLSFFLSREGRKVKLRRPGTALPPPPSPPASVLTPPPPPPPTTLDHDKVRRIFVILSMSCSRVTDVRNVIVIISQGGVALSSSFINVLRSKSIASSIVTDPFMLIEMY